MADNTKIQMHFVKGISKKNGREWYAIEVVLPTISGNTRTKMVFLNPLEIEVCGLNVANFETR